MKKTINIMVTQHPKTICGSKILCTYKPTLSTNENGKVQEVNTQYSLFSIKSNLNFG